MAVYTEFIENAGNWLLSWIIHEATKKGGKKYRKSLYYW